MTAKPPRSVAKAARVAHRRLEGPVQRWIMQPPRRRQLTRGGPRLFESVFFELRTRCNSHCAFCAASVDNESRPDLLMPWPLFEKVVSELAELSFEGIVGFFVNNEPLLVPDLARYVAHARAVLPRAWLQIFTNGRSLNRARGEPLLAAGIDEISVNWYTQDVEAPLPDRLVEFRDVILPRYHTQDRVLSGSGPLERGDRSIFRFNIYPRKIDAVLTSRGGTAPNKTGVSGQRGFCEHPFLQFSITASGDVSKCCADLFFSEPMGNVAEQHVRAIWFGAQFSETRRCLERGKRDFSALCDGCDYHGVITEYSGNFVWAAHGFLRGLRRLGTR